MGLRLRSHFHSFPWYCESPGKNLNAQEPWLDRIKTKTDKKKCPLVCIQLKHWMEVQICEEVSRIQLEITSEHSREFSYPKDNHRLELFGYK